MAKIGYDRDTKEVETMKEYVCTVCGYVHKGELPDDFRCPICGAGKDAFKEITKVKQTDVSKRPEDMPDKELSAAEMSVICSNLARGCEKQYLSDESEKFRQLAEFFAKASRKKTDGGTKDLLALVEKDLEEGYPYAKEVAEIAGDRGAMRSLVWSEKVTGMLRSILSRYEKEGEGMLENTGVYVCTVCGFVYVGDSAPALCPVCKVPSWKFERVQRRAQ